MKVTLIRKLADRLDGVDVSAHREGDVIDLAPADARMLMAEGWALPMRASTTGTVRRKSHAPVRAMAADRRRPARPADEFTIASDIDRPREGQQERRRAEDRIREELHDARARTVPGDEKAGS